jgi:thiamine pyrophosphate-dependent acetolactate synthase large subunit-like protein
VPKDVGAASFDNVAAKEARRGKADPTVPLPPPGQADDLGRRLGRVIELIRVAQRPIIMCGKGMLNTLKGPGLLRMLAERQYASQAKRGSRSKDLRGYEIIFAPD